MAAVPLLGWGFSGLNRRLRQELQTVDGRLDDAEATIGDHEDRLDAAEESLNTIETWAVRIKGFSSSAPTPGQDTQVGDIYLATTPTAGGYIGWVAVQVDSELVFRGFGAIAGS